MSRTLLLGLDGATRTSLDPLFAAGVILWELYTNQRLFAGSSELEVMHRVRDARVSGVQTNNQFRPEILQTIKEAEFCVPSVVVP